MTISQMVQEKARTELIAWLPFCETQKIQDIEFLHRGKRSLVFKGKQNGIDIVLKIPNPEHDVTARLQIEADMLKRVNALNLGPKIISCGKHNEHDYIIEDFIAGTSFEDYILSCAVDDWKHVAHQLLEQCFVMDKAGLSKEEMQRPFTNAIVTPEKQVVLIDFERMHPDTNPKNVRQCVQFLTGQRVTERFHAPSKEMIKLLLQQYSEVLGRFHEKRVPLALFEKVFFAIREMVL